MESIILKATDGRIQPLSVKNLLNQSKAGASRRSGDACKPEIKVLKVGSDVRGVEVRCSCGEVTVVELTYPQA
ncbi:MAG: hypothetical protein ACI87O_002313 [Planctomycetota bacterium]|jgi:hypothetical protein